MRQDGTVWCWGYYYWGQLGDGRSAANSVNSNNYSSLVAVQSVGLSNVAEVASGQTSTCARTNTGSVYCWGRNNGGQVGNGTQGDSSPNTVQLFPQQVASFDILNTVQLSGVNQKFSALQSDGTEWHWGSPGIGNEPAVMTTPVPLVGLSGIVKVANSSYGGCYLTTQGAIYCRGRYVQSAAGTETPVEFPLPDNEIPIDIEGGHYNICALADSGKVYCFGPNNIGQIGDGSTNDRYSFTPANLPRPATAIALGGGHACALLNDSTVRCWGRNDTRQLGAESISRCSYTDYRGIRGTFACSRTPVQNQYLTSIRGIHANMLTTCAQHETGAVYCWGWNAYGQIGNKSQSTTVSSPTRMTVMDAPGDGACDVGESTAFTPQDCCACGSTRTRVTNGLLCGAKKSGSAENCEISVCSSCP